MFTKKQRQINWILVAVLLVLSSEPYDAEEYIRDYDAFVREVNGHA